MTAKTNDRRFSVIRLGVSGAPAKCGASKTLEDLLTHLPKGDCTYWGIPFHAMEPVIIGEGSAEFTLDGGGKGCPYLVFMHTADIKEPVSNADGFIKPVSGNPMLGDAIGKYVLKTASGREYAQEITRRYQTTEITQPFGEGSFTAVPHFKPGPVFTTTDAMAMGIQQDVWWGDSQTRVRGAGASKACAYLFAMENPCIDEDIVSLSLTVNEGSRFILLALTACFTDINPLVWDTRKKLRVKAPAGQGLTGMPDETDIDMGSIISVTPYQDYDNDNWGDSYNNKLPNVVKDEAIIEYTAHPDANLIIRGERFIPLGRVPDGNGTDGWNFIDVSPATHTVNIRVVDGATGMVTPVKFHAHGEHGEYLPPRDRHRIINPHWFEDYSADFVHMANGSSHSCTYINGETSLNLPLGKVYIEIAKGYEIKPLHLVYDINPDTKEIVITLEKVLKWRERGWVSADTHVHFLSPNTALLEGEGEGVNVVHLLASQWGELFTNIGDFDGKSVIKGGDYMVRVGTENRQCTLGHISLLGYDGSIILPLTTGGPGESALGDGIETGLCDWAAQARAQNGVVVLPHFPRPRAESAAAIALDRIDGVEMTSWSDLYSGLSPYSLSDWYGYLNCGYHVAVVGGTDKMAATTAVGTVRTYSYIGDIPFEFDQWKQSVREGRTFVTYGPLLDFHVEGERMGGSINLPPSGGTLDISWCVSSCTVPVTRVELVVNGDTRGEKRIDDGLCEQSGSFSFKAEGSCWMALRVRGCYPGKPEILLAHSSAVMVTLDGKPCFSAPDAMNILEQIEGTMAFVNTMSSKSEERRYKAIISQILSAHRALHNKMHQNGVFHNHTPMDDHPEHHH